MLEPAIAHRFTTTPGYLRDCRRDSECERNRVREWSQWLIETTKWGQLGPVARPAGSVAED